MKTGIVFTVLFSILLVLTPMELIEDTMYDVEKNMPVMAVQTNDVTEDYIFETEEISIYRFMNMIAEIESNNTHDAVNRFGMLGKYQFSPTTIEFLGYEVSTEEFLASPTLQDSVMISYMKSNNRALRKLIREYEGKVINDILITRAGILAGAHFAGAGGIRQYLVTNGFEGVEDSNGMTIDKYMKMFSEYDIPPQINL